MLIDSTDGVGVAVHDLGGPTGVDGGGPVLLLVHANGFNAEAWRPFAAELVAAGERVVALDLRGHGAARTPDDLDWEWDGFADDVVAVLDAGVLPAGPVHGIGHSLGGAALLTAAARRPGALRSLWLFEPIAPPPDYFMPADRPNPMAEAAERRRPSFESLDAAYANYASKPPLAAFHPDALRGYVEGGFEPDPSGPPGSVRLRCRPEWEAAIFRMTGGSPGWEAAPTVDIPVTVAMGEESPGPSAFAPLVADRLPKGRLVRHPELGHFGPLQAPAAMAAEVAAWVAGG
jgi:pimeloyl-ACP methyl ester carboxylesterase